MALNLLPTYRYPAIPYAEIAWRHHHRRRRPSILFVIAALRRLVIIPAAIVLLIPTLYFLATVPSPLPKVSIDSFSVTKFNATSTRDVSVEFDATVRAEHRLLSASVRCFHRGTVSVFYSGVTIAEGVSPEFCQWTGRVTEFHTTLKGSNIVLSVAESDGLERKQRRGDLMALEVEIKLPSRFADVVARCRVIRACSELKAQTCAVEEKSSFQQKVDREVLSCLLMLALWVLIVSILAIDLLGLVY
ncbi:putative NDR1/HIN1-like protein 2 [Cocos nucifera]|uniref:Putative NDR1/HIN1-like protein 2 n=1 Tax=Cocos nucifera TaxID=13894 RepID=A0A8K0IDX7_COCNU|nr:putative NDR1/HIN1-like protein 2 [Cocos nucifera]